jgi:4-hydroxy-4-methyl-2-oxoglutarate aldolase
LTTASITTATLKKLAQYDSATICNIIELFDVRPNDVGYMDHRVAARFSDMKPMVGFAATASLRSLSGSRRTAYTMLESQLKQFGELPGPAIVVFQDLDDPPVGATFGEVMCSTYQAFGSVGLITSGGGRDIAQIRTLNYPVFCASAIVSHAYCQTVDVGSAVRVGGLEVQTGNLLHGDANGVAGIPIEIADEVADVAEEFLAAEACVLDYVKAEGPKDRAELGVRRQLMAESLVVLRRRVSRKSGK